MESESEVKNDEASNAGESCNTNGEIPNETQEMSVEFHDSNGNTENKMKQTQEERTTSSIYSEPPASCELNVESGASSNAGQLGIANMRSGSIHGEEGDTAH